MNVNWSKSKSIQGIDDNVDKYDNLSHVQHIYQLFIRKHYEKSKNNTYFVKYVIGYHFLWRKKGYGTYFFPIFQPYTAQLPANIAYTSSLFFSVY